MGWRTRQHPLALCGRRKVKADAANGLILLNFRAGQRNGIPIRWIRTLPREKASLSEVERVDTPKQEALWVLRAQCGDREALELLLRHIQPSLHRYLRGLIGSTEADDLLQEVLVLVFRKLTWLESPELFRPWVFRIASRAAFRHLKPDRHQQAWDDSMLQSVPAPDTRPSDELLRQLESSNALSPASRAVLLMHFKEDMSLTEVAAILGLPLGTVKSRLAYGLTTLRKQLRKRRSV